MLHSVCFIIQKNNNEKIILVNVWVSSCRRLKYVNAIVLAMKHKLVLLEN